MLIAVGTARAQVDTLTLPFGALTIDDGLSQGLVGAIAQDRFGFLWFGTKDGLNRYDGYNFKVFRHDAQDGTSLSGNTVTGLYVDDRQRLWVATTAGVDLFDPSTERFRHVPIPHQAEWLGRSAQLCVDPAGDLWLATANGIGKVTFDTPVKEGASLPGSHWTKYDGEECKLTVCSDGLLYGGTRQYGFRITPVHGGLDRIDTLLARPLGGLRTVQGNLSFVEDTVRKAIYAVGDQCIAKLDPATGSHVMLLALGDASPYPPLFDPVVDDRGMLWLNSMAGVFRFDPATRRLSLVQPMKADLRKASVSVKSIFEERGGTIWVGSAGYGLLKYDPRSARFNTWEDRSIRGLRPGGSGSVVVTHFDGLVSVFDPALRRYTRQVNSAAELGPGPAALLGQRSSEMTVEAEPGVFWCAMAHAQLLRFEAKTGGTRVIQPTLPDGTRETGSMFPLLTTAGGGLWAGGEHALWRCDGLGNGLVPFPWPVLAVNSPYHFASALLEGPDGRIWAATMQGLLCLDPRTARWKQYRARPADGSSLPTDILLSLCQDPEDPVHVLWIGTDGGGMVRFDVRSGAAQSITTGNGLPNDVVYGILADGTGGLWVSTNKGLSRFDLRTRTFRNFTEADGLQGNEFNRYAYCALTDGSLCFGGVDGFNCFKPADLVPDSSLAPVRITGIKLLNDPVRFGGNGAPLAVPAYLSAGMTIPYAANMVGVEFATMEFSAPRQHSYQYRLDGFDKDWVMAGHEHTAIYTNLDPGTYTFRVRGDNRDGVWDTGGTAFTLTVLPPWWRTWWAWALYVALVAGGVVTYIRLRTAGLKRQRALLERTVAERTIELSRQKDEADRQRERAEHSERVKQQFLANMSHEIRTPMNAIVGMGNVLRRNAHLPEQQPYIDAITGSSGNLLAIVNEILDLSKIESGKLELEKVRMEPRAVLNSVVDVLHYRAEEKGLAIAAHVAREVPVAVLGDPVRLNQVLMNLVGNAIKFTERGSVQVEVAMQENWTDAVMLRFTVTDTGIGIAPDRLAHVFKDFMQAESDHTRKYGGTGLGLAISKRLVEMQGGTIEVVSDPGRGSSFTFTVPYAHAPVATRQPDNDHRTSGPHPRALHILLVEDNKLNVLVAQEELKNAVPGCVIDVATNGRSALTSLATKTYDLILMDVQMPVMDGYAATRAIRGMEGAKARIPIVAMTANVLQAEVRQCMEAGMDGFVPKPFRQEELVEAIAKAMGGGHPAQ